MPQKTAVLAIALTIALLAAACGGDDATPTATSPTLPASNATAPPTEAIARPTATVDAGSNRGAAGLGDSVFPGFGNGGYDALDYILDLTFDPAGSEVSGRVTVQAVATQVLSAFNLDFGGPAVSEVQVNGAAASFIAEDRELTIVPANTIADGETFTSTVIYSGQPSPFFMPGFPFPTGWTTVPGDTVLFHGPAMGLFPINQTSRDGATYTVRLTVPKPLVAAASGQPVTTTDNGDTTTYEYRLDKPSAGLLGPLAFAIGDFEIVDLSSQSGLPVQLYLARDLPDQFRRVFQLTPQILAFYADVFGPYPFSSLGLTGIVANLPFAGFAGAAHILMTGPSGQVTAHEIAHQWFGHAVTPAGSADNWLSEGFATYAQLLWVEHRRGAEALTAELTNIYRRLGPSTLPPALINSTGHLLDRAVYQRGALTLHALRVRLGDDTFFDTLRQFVERFLHGPVSTSDFMGVAEEVSGQELDDLFDDWLFVRPVPPADQLGLAP